MYIKTAFSGSLFFFQKIELKIVYQKKHQKTLFNKKVGKQQNTSQHSSRELRQTSQPK
jgi:hypothetical protein